MFNPLQYHESQGVKFHMKSKINRIVSSSADSKIASSVEITDSSGETVSLEADFVVLAVGVRPATDFLKESEGVFTLEKDGGIKVDEFLRVPNIGDVFAIGGSTSICMSILYVYSR